MKSALLVALGVLTATYLVVWVRSVQRAGGRGPAGEGPRPGARHLLIGFVTNFFDTLGIGSFATTTSIFRFLRLVPDELIPGTLNVGHTTPSVTQAFIYIVIVSVAMPTLAAMIAAAVAGAWLGAGVVCRWSRVRVQRGMGSALLAAAGLMLMTQLGLVPLGGTALALTGERLAIGIAVNFVLGALMTLGIGLYALLRKTGVMKILPPQLRKMEQMLPPEGKLWPAPLPDRISPSPAGQSAAPPRAAARTTVGFFPGCIGSVMFESVNRQAVELLAACGMTVLITDYFDYYRLAAYIAERTTERVGIPSDTTDFSVRASVGQACTHAPHETHSELRKSVPPALILESKPRPSTVRANVPWMSAQARTQREQTMQEAASKAK